MQSRVGRRFGRVAGAAAVLVFFAFSVVVFVTPAADRAPPSLPSQAPDPSAEPAAETSPSAPHFPGRSTLPIRVPDSDDLTTSVSFRMRRGEARNQVRLELIVPHTAAAVLASTAATVLEARPGWNQRVTLILETPAGHRLTYRNLSSASVAPGQTVREDEQIGVAAPAGGAAVGSLLWYQVDTGWRYYPLFILVAQGSPAGRSWTLQVGPGGRALVTDE